MTIGVTTLPTRFWEKVDKSGDCWIWTGAKNDQGYGQQWLGGRKGRCFYAHRLSYQDAHGAIPDGLHIDHLCRTRLCVNPDHLEPVTCRENVRRGASPSARLARADTCHAGHPRTAANTRPATQTQGRQCRVCQRARYHRERATAATK